MLLFVDFGIAEQVLLAEGSGWRPKQQAGLEQSEQSFFSRDRPQMDDGSGKPLRRMAAEAIARYA
jgi:hypothetical protein